MPIPAPNLYPAFNIVRLSHVELMVTDLAASRAFYVDTLGLQVTDEDDQVIYLRAMEERGHHCMILRKGGTPEVNSLSYKLYSEDDLDKARDWFAAKGLPVEWVTRPYQGRTLRTTDLFGSPMEFYFKMDRLQPIHQKYALYHGVKPLRIDHFNCFSPDVDESVAFYNEMGFRVTEYTEDEESGNLWAAWMHRKGGIHDIAFTNGRGPRLHHTAFWVPTPLNIIDLLDLMSTTGYLSNIERGPGRHGISNAFFLYILDPDGHRIEIYCSDYQTVDPDLEPIKWDLTDPQRQTLWGAPAPKSWFEHGSAFAGVDSRDSKMKAQPIIAP
ncbi:Manganese-dependent 2,3-dihydroxybiphenyl 1,2-dioxygenase [Thalassovita gelatinovora]|uniref:Manganese-dependent 2,3-dihydroxybiphenyl 1,2-dioxygenase n=1 Tax=Thalassovita gelatinovora TaxID=53501 RepID=A0A0P1G4H8_THAGE|nr:3,4-dihydroxyphenylacetate 2,3-dioxygenase [Thalassovita gelatinovora]QIZ81847.1 3,4-dihydroxyphenylacetate 2,3-dioxygenase [Thalassovita gelatinovora]CUH67157.1 Manganese-dependent 2,3-dihydroxybiphenyl 1,2-dioxygenase [Thalassovita gelatinovora]SEP79540.1 catechol 2,3-dioxygenase [Thalassovita gelatinovora]